MALCVPLKSTGYPCGDRNLIYPLRLVPLLLKFFQGSFKAVAQSLDFRFTLLLHLLYYGVGLFRFLMYKRVYVITMQLFRFLKAPLNGTDNLIHTRQLSFHPVLGFADLSVYFLLLTITCCFNFGYFIAQLR